MSQGCNIPDIDIVVQWKLPSTVSSFVQRAGRAARGPGRTGLAVLLVEKSIYEADLEKLKDIPSKSKSKAKASGKVAQTVRKPGVYAKGPKEYALNHGVKRGSFGGEHDTVSERWDVPLDVEAPDEGLHSLAQTGTCRRQVLRMVFQNEKPRTF